MNRSDLLLKKRNAPEQRQKRGCRGSTELPIVVARRSWREISCGKLDTLIQPTKNSLNFVSTCLKVVDAPCLAKQHLAPSLGHKHHMILTVPTGMR